MPLHTPKISADELQTLFNTIVKPRISDMFQEEPKKKQMVKRSN